MTPPLPSPPRGGPRRGAEAGARVLSGGLTHLPATLSLYCGISGGVGGKVEPLETCVTTNQCFGVDLKRKTNSATNARL